MTAACSRHMCAPSPRGSPPWIMKDTVGMLEGIQWDEDQREVSLLTRGSSRPLAHGHVLILGPRVAWALDSTVFSIWLPMLLCVTSGQVERAGVQTHSPSHMQVTGQRKTCQPLVYPGCHRGGPGKTPQRNEGLDGRVAMQADRSQSRAMQQGPTYALAESHRVLQALELGLAADPGHKHTWREWRQ